MRKLINIARLLRIDSFIRRKGSGPPIEFAQKLGISKTTLFEYLTYLKEEQMAIIHYNRYSQNYEYEKEPDLLHNSLNEELAKAVKGGQNHDCKNCPLTDCPRRKDY